MKNSQKSIFLQFMNLIFFENSPGIGPKDTKVKIIPVEALIHEKTIPLRTHRSPAVRENVVRSLHKLLQNDYFET